MLPWPAQECEDNTTKGLLIKVVFRCWKFPQPGLTQKSTLLFAGS